MPSEAIATRTTRSALRFQTRDLAWLLFVTALILSDPETNYSATIVIVFFGAFQIAEPRLKLFSSPRGRVVSIVMKMILSYLLVGFSHAIESFYYLIFLISIISAATIFGPVGVIVVTAIAALSYFSFLLPIFIPPDYLMPAGLINLMFLRVFFYAIVAYVVYEQAKGKREEMARTQQAAERLAESNRQLRVAQVSLRRSERLAALGQLTAGLAHELRNPLGTIKASAEMLTKESTRTRPEVMTEMAGYIGSEVDRMNGLVSSFLDFAKPLQIRPVLRDVRPIIEEIVRQQTELAKGREVTVSIQMNIADPAFAFDPDLLKSALSNLVENAIQASAPGQAVEIRIDSTDENILIFVTDHGKGIQPEHLESIFNPFFTTKPQGVGLGLAIVAKVIDEHQGRINVFSEPGAGTRFELILPKVQAI